MTQRITVDNAGEDVLDRFESKRLLKALLLLMLDEFNRSRQADGAPVITVAQAKAALLNKLKKV